MRIWVSAVILVAWASATATFGQPPSPSPLDPEWRWVAEVDWIVRARLEVPKGELDGAIRTGVGDRHRIKLDVVEMIKGGVGVGPVECVYWSGDDYTPSPRVVQSLDGGEVLVFAYEWGEGKGTTAHDKRAIRRYKPGEAEQLRREELNQRLIAEGFAKLPAAKPDEFEGVVRGLIGKMLAKETQQDAVDALRKLDPRAAPSIIRLMDDRRPLAVKYIALPNTAPDAFEGIRHYKPVVAVDALSAVLPELTGVGFGHIENGGSEKERRKAVDAWRTYLHYRTGSKSASESRGLPPSPAKRSPAGGNP